MTRPIAWLGLFLSVLPPVARALDGGSWSDRFYGNAPDGGVATMIVYDDALYIGGNFASIGPTLARRVAKFDGAVWSPLGAGTDGQVLVLAEYRSDLIAGGTFHEAGGAPASGIARWDGREWHPLAEGTDSSVRSLVEFDGDLIAGGTFQSAGGVAASRVARWDGAAWHAMGEGFAYTVSGLAVYRGELYAGSVGYIEEPDDSRLVACIWRWNGIAWTPVSTVPEYGIIGGDAPGVTSLRVLDDRLYAIGQYMMVDDGVGDLCYWDGTRWTGLPWGYTDSRWEDQYAAVLLPYEGHLVLGGCFWGPGEGDSHSLAVFEDSGWAPFPGGGVYGYTDQECYPVRVLAEFRGSLYVAGGFLGVGDQPIPMLARWDGVQWNEVAPWGQGIIGDVLTLAYWDGRLVAGGRFVQAAGLSARHIAILEDGGWQPMGPGLDGEVAAVVPFDGGLAAGGRFTRSGEQPVRRVAFWDGSSWGTLGSGIEGNSVNALAVHHGALVAGGRFTTAGQTAARNMARWDGANWGPMGPGLDGNVFALEVHEGNLFAAGDFTGHVARWDPEGDRWLVDGQGLTLRMQSLQSTPDGLYAAGQPGFWRHTGTGWMKIDMPHGIVNCIGAHKGDLIAGGRFVLPLHEENLGLIRWDGSAWTAVAGGPRPRPYAMTTNGFDLAVGGSFWSTGEVAAWGVALYEEEEPATAPLSFLATRFDASVAISCEMARGAEALTYLLYREAAGHERTRVSSAPLTGRRQYEVVDSLPPWETCDYWVEQISCQGDHIAWFGPANAAASSELWPFVDLRILPDPSPGPVSVAFNLTRPVRMKLDLFDVLGRTVAVLQDGMLGPCACQIDWDGRTADGRRLSDGVYWVALRTGGGSQVRKLVRVH